jgi:hypothetical protein
LGFEGSRLKIEEALLPTAVTSTVVTLIVNALHRDAMYILWLLAATEELRWQLIFGGHHRVLLSTLVVFGNLLLPFLALFQNSKFEITINSTQLTLESESPPAAATNFTFQQLYTITNT